MEKALGQGLNKSLFSLYDKTWSFFFWQFNLPKANQI